MSKAKMQSKKIYPVILCGGSGSRLWPVSRSCRPKQFLKLITDNSMFQETLKLVSNPKYFHKPTIVTSEELKFLASGQLEDIGLTPGLTILEPEGRNTAPAIAIAALSIGLKDPNSTLLVLPSDHLIEDATAFRKAVQVGAWAAEKQVLVTFGIPADRPATGYGYIRQGKKLKHGRSCFAVDSFIEKPKRAKAQAMLESGGHFWNSGLFMFKTTKYLESLMEYAPEVLSQCHEAYELGTRNHDVIKPHEGSFSKVPAISIDYAVMEHTDDAVVVTTDMGWSDIGSWKSLAAAVEPDGAGNYVPKDTVLEDCTGLHVQGSGRLITAIGLDNLVIVDTKDALLIVPKERSQDVKRVVKQLKEENRAEVCLHRKVHRPWGTYEGVHWGGQHQVKHIVVAPGAKLSLQFHHHRSEHWTIVKGTAEVTRDDELLTLGPDQSIYIPQGAVHRIHNPGTEPVHLIEVQIGTYLGEDDIVRLDDIYGRTANLEKEAAE